MENDMSMIALSCTIMSAICLALMLTTDPIMVGDCYKNKPNQAWFVTSVLGSLTGLMITCLVWYGAVCMGEVASISVLISTAKNFAFGRGIAMLVVGGLSGQLLLYYFRCFGNKASSATVAMWLATTPVFVHIIMFLITIFVPIDGVATTSVNPMFAIGVVMATMGIVWFESITGSDDERASIAKENRKDLIMLLVLSVISVILLKQVLHPSEGKPDELVEVLALMPFYWIGFGAGARVILKSEERKTFKLNWKRRVKYFILPIIFTEVFGMLVFFFEYLGLTELDPALVSVISGASVFMVYGINIKLGRMKREMEVRNIHRRYFMGVRLLARKLPQPNINKGVVVKEVCAMTLLIIGITFVSLGS